MGAQNMLMWEATSCRGRSSWSKCLTPEHHPKGAVRGEMASSVPAQFLWKAWGQVASHLSLTFPTLYIKNTETHFGHEEDIKS